jgi:hypothetical protein
MGAGVAKLVRDRYVGCDEVLGALIRANGNICQQFLQKPVVLIAFPTKNDYKDNSSLQLIEQSARQLKVWSNEHPEYTRIFLPRPGTGLGGLKWFDVKQILQNILTEDKFITITN